MSENPTLAEIRARDALKGNGHGGVTMTQAEADRRTLLRMLDKKTLPTTWTDQDGTVYDLTRPLLDQDGSYWHHVGWITFDETMPLMAWTLTPDPLGVSKRWADVSMLRAIIEESGPLTTVEPED